jgi:hypothetical protein
MTDKTREQVAGELFDASLKALKTKLESGEATAADHAVALNVARYLRVSALPVPGSPAAGLLAAAEQHLPFPAGDSTH